MNKCFLSGRLVRDPEIRTTRAGKMTTSFMLAVDHYAGGEKKTDFIKIVTWEKLAENCGNSLTKGQRALVDGRLQIRSFDGKDGQKRWVTEIVAQSVEFLERRKDQQDTPRQHDLNDPASQFGQDVAPDEFPY